MDILLVIAVVVILAGLFAFTGLIAALRTAAWLILLLGLAILAMSFLI